MPSHPSLVNLVSWVNWFENDNKMREPPKIGTSIRCSTVDEAESPELSSNRQNNSWEHDVSEQLSHSKSILAEAISQ